MNGGNLRVLIIESRFYASIADELCRGAIASLQKVGVCFECISVPGALELPLALALASEGSRYDAYVMLGCVIRGETSHYDIVAGETVRAIMNLAIAKQLAVGNGILTVENIGQAWGRACIDGKDKGGVAARTALHMVSLRHELRSLDVQ